jgi:AcrR family transcriptional regulator
MPAQAKEHSDGHVASVGRPRSEASRRLVLSTTIKLLQKQTVQAISVEGIAREAGVSKATIYRWWNSKASIVIDAFIENHLLKTPMPRDLPPREAIARHFESLVTQFAGWSGSIVGQIIAEAQFDQQIAREFRERFHYGRRAIVREVLDDWRRSGEINTNTNVEVLMDVLYGPVYMRLLVGHAPLDHNFVRDHLTFVYTLLGVTPPRFDGETGALIQSPGNTAEAAEASH